MRVGFALRLAFAGVMAVSAIQIAEASAQCVAETARADADKIHAHLEFLADDLLEGRRTGTRGYDLAARYVASQFKLLGLKPGGDSGSYFQTVPMLSSVTEGDASAATLVVNGTEIPLELGKSFGMPGGFGAADETASAPLVFVGYGVKDDALGYDDYQGIDVKGKIVAAFMGTPPSLPPDQGAYHMPPDKKMATAREQGAKGLVLLWNPGFEQIFPWASAMHYLSLEQMNALDKEGHPVPGFADMSPLAFIDVDHSRQLFDGAEESYDEAFERAKTNRTTPFALSAEIRLHRRSTQKPVTSRNVVGILEGSDPALKGEYVVYSAHLDHLGVGDGDSGDRIYNGLYDNATGVAMIIETARLMAAAPERPRRSVLFLATTGEEEGEIGAGYFAANPTVPAKAIVADVNIDMPILTFPVNDVIVFGADHSSLEEQVAAATRALGVTNSPDPTPEQGLFVRSDQLPFIEQGVPSVFLATGITSRDPAIDGAAKRNEFLEKYYHQVSDDLAAPFDRRSAEMFANVNYLIGLYVANATERPHWKAGDFFGKAFAGAGGN